MTLFHWQLTPHQHFMDFGKIYFKAQKNPYLHKMTPKPRSKTHGNIISSKPMVQAHGTTSHFWLMIQAHESQRGNFGSHGLEGQEVFNKVLAVQS